MSERWGRDVAAKEMKGRGKLEGRRSKLRKCYENNAKTQKKMVPIYYLIN